MLAILSLLVLVPQARAADKTTPQRPNILWLSTEDMSRWIGPYGDKTVPTPNLDRLAREGTVYDNAFATSPVCAPARHTIITGLYATSTGAMHMRNGQPSREVLSENPRAYDEIPSYEAVPPDDVRCFSEFLRINGYYCTNNVKQDYQFNAPVTAWDESSRRAHWRNRQEGQPFFAVFNCTFTHEGQAFPKAEKRSDVAKPEDMKVPPIYPDTPTVRKTLAQTYNNIAAMDQWVGERIAELEEAGLLDSTIIVYYSDHGVGLPRGKRLCYDTGLRVPLIVRFPDGKKAGTRDDRLVSFLDFAPTALSLAGIKPKPYMKGHPFLGEFKTDPPKYVFATQDRMDINIDRSRAVSDGRFKYIRNFYKDRPYLPKAAYRDRLAMMKDIVALRDSAKATPAQWQMIAQTKPAEEFYDTQDDPWEVHNLIDEPTPEQRQVLDAMRNALDEWLETTQDLGGIQPESKLVKEVIWPPDGVQPTTATPEVQLDESAEGKPTLTVQCPTAGASIGYRKTGDHAWQVYVAPLAVEPGKYEVVAHRIGFKPSDVVIVE